MTKDFFYRIRFEEAGPDGMVSPVAIINYMQDAATRQSSELGVGGKELACRKEAWIVYRWDLRIKEYPLYGSELRVRTSVRSFDMYNLYRDFIVYDSVTDKEVAEGCSQWLLFDLEHRRLKKIPAEYGKNYGVIPSEEYIRYPKVRVRNFSGYTREFRLEYSDLDANGHGNNSRTVEWLIDSLPADINREWKIEELRCMYKKETVYGKTYGISSGKIQTDGGLVTEHKVSDEAGGTVLLASMKWVKER